MSSPPGEDGGEVDGDDGRNKARDTCGNLSLSPLSGEGDKPDIPDDCFDYWMGSWMNEDEQGEEYPVQDSEEQDYNEDN